MNYLDCTPSPHPTTTSILDSGCTGHFLITNNHIKYKSIAETPLKVHLQNGPGIASTHTATFDILSLPMTSRQAHVLPGLDQHSLLSVGKMCDSGCAFTFTSNTVTAKHGVATILVGTRGLDYGLWRVTLHQPPPCHAGPQHADHNIYEQKSVQDTILYLHAC
jgi:hypothetical protein